MGERSSHFHIFSMYLQKLLCTVHTCANEANSAYFYRGNVSFVINLPSPFVQVYVLPISTKWMVISMVLQMTRCGPSPNPLGWLDSLSLFLKSSVEWNGKVVFEFWKIRPRWGTVLFGVATYFLFLFFKREKLSKNKNPWWLQYGKSGLRNLSLGPGIRLPIGKVPHMR